jgi:hypothetical protein
VYQLVPVFGVSLTHPFLFLGFLFLTCNFVQPPLTGGKNATSSPALSRVFHGEHKEAAHYKPPRAVISGTAKDHH